MNNSVFFSPLWQQIHQSGSSVIMLLSRLLLHIFLVRVKFILKNYGKYEFKIDMLYEKNDLSQRR